MATKHVTVVQTTELIVEIQDELLTPEAIKEFESFMFDVDDDPDNLFAYAATMYVRGYNSAEGLGTIGKEIKIQELDQDHEIEVSERKEQ